jgi:cell division transport system permease protein
MKMRIRTVNFIFKEGFSNLFRNKLMFFASCAIVTAALIILGIFLLIIFNIDENIKALDEKPQVQVYCDFELTDNEVDALEAVILSRRGIKDFLRITKDEAFVRAKELLGENSDILDEIEPDFLPVSFILKLEESDMIFDFVQWLEEIPGISKISYPKRTIDLIAGVSNWTKVFGAVLAGIPILFAIFIVSNTIRLAVFERRNEISIMRYIGATERIIRWPFIVEGVITGIVGATVAFLATGFGYKFVENSFNPDMAYLTDDLFKLVGIGSVSSILLSAYMCIGVGVGAAGSARSVSKYLKA